MIEDSTELQPTERRRASVVAQSMWAALAVPVRRMIERLLRRPETAAREAWRASDDALEQLHDLNWQIADNARRYRDLLDAQGGLIVRLDSEKRVVFANRAYLAAFGWREHELAGRHHEPHVLETDATVSQCVELVETVAGPRWIAWEDTSCGDSGAALETQRTGRDITQERRDAEDLRCARDAALEASRAKSRFLANMSHEIRTPMNGILGMADLLLDGDLTSDQQSYARTIAQSARALMSLIDEILDFSRIEAGKLVLANAPFSITETVEGCLALLEPKAADKGIALSFHTVGDPISLLSGDEPRVRQVVLNLVSNAVKFTDIGSVKVVLSARDGPRQEQVTLMIAVEDTGIGLSTAECAAVFGEFEQADAVIRRQDGGSGLGLTIARRIANAMQGDVTVVSEPGRGSAFIAELIFDRAEADNGSIPHANRKASPACRIAHDKTGGRGIARVLLAEDNAINALLATRLLEREDCEVVRVFTGDEAVAAVVRSLAGEEAPYDLVLMDIYMPGLDGIEASLAIRRLLAAAGTAAPPIVAVTANAFPEDRMRYLSAGMDDFLAKPFDRLALTKVLRRWVGPSRRETPAA